MDLRSQIAAWAPEPQWDEVVIGGDGAAEFSYMLGLERPSEVLPPLWHWFEFRSRYSPSDLGEDGHPLTDPLLPPLVGRRRMWAGGRFEMLQDFRVGTKIIRKREVVAATVKDGRSGDFLLVTERHTYTSDDERLAIDEFDLVYRSSHQFADVDVVATQVHMASRTPIEHQVQCLKFSPDPITLFLFSALTANSHRIHYDVAYAKGVEGHRDLVVHGPLIALLMAEVARHEGRGIRTLSTRISAPAFVGETLEMRADDLRADGVRDVVAQVIERDVVVGRGFIEFAGK